jgi:hypothetical protein
MTEFHLKPAASGYLQGMLKSFFPVIAREGSRHFLPGFEKKFILGKLQPLGIIHGLSGLNAEKGIMGLRILSLQVMTIIGCDKGEGEIPGDLFKEYIDLIAARETVGLTSR